MIDRYANQKINELWSLMNKRLYWRRVELAIIRARVGLNLLAEEVCLGIEDAMEANPPDIEWWLNREKETNHDLEAALDDDRRWLTPEQQAEYHKDMTSYDTEDPAFALLLQDSVGLVSTALAKLGSQLAKMALKYRYTPFIERTHGQEAQLASFGKRILTWLAQIDLGVQNLETAAEALKFAKLSGAIGNYDKIASELEKEALGILDLKPFYGATQIMPRELYAPLAQALCQVCETINKIGIDIRLGARSGRPICQEPFGKKQKGSSAMPHKKNTIRTEQEEGLGRMAEGRLLSLTRNIVTWEGRAIEQSCVERVDWPDLFHITLQSLKVITGVLEGLQVYPDNMMLEIIDSRGCYAAGSAKEFLRQNLAKFNISTEEAYRIVQLAAFNVFQPSKLCQEFREHLPGDLNQARVWLDELEHQPRAEVHSIREWIAEGMLYAVPELGSSVEQVAEWNKLLRSFFLEEGDRKKWNALFDLTVILQGEKVLYKEILNED
jgi:adenylosuccinate lyase